VLQATQTRGKSEDKTKGNVQKLRISDAIFFGPEDLHVGSVMRYMGRTAPNSNWEITRIESFRLKGNGTRYQIKRVKTAEHLHDYVYMTCTHGLRRGETVCVTVGYASYSAIWRIAP